MPVRKFPPAPAYAVIATIKINETGHPIREEIYGVSTLPRDKLVAYAIPITRWGGNRSSRYNWNANADSAGRDWFFKNGGSPAKDEAQTGWVRFVRENQERGATAYVTAPTLGFVAKDRTSYGFSVNKYGKQQATETGHPDVGSGLRPDGTPVTGNDWRDTSVEAGPKFIADGVRLVVRHTRPGTRYWALDNEPMLWHETHRDVRPKPLGYDELWDRTVGYAEAIRAADPSAKIAGFCSWGWTDLFYSAADEGGDRYRSRPDYHAHGQVPLAEWFIRKCGEYKRAHGRPLVDVFDFHWYPQAQADGRGPYMGTGKDLKLNDLRLRTTRDLWDPAYEPESWIKRAGDGKATMVLRRVRAWIDKHNPGMEVCLGEYNFGGGDNISGALAQADVFGILARERVDLAFIWSRPEGTQELAWKLFRNYDGAGGRFGDLYLPSECECHDLTVYAAKRIKDRATTIAVINKNLGSPSMVKLNVAGLKGKMRVWQFDQETDGRVVERTKDAGDVDGSITVTVPAASGTMIVLE
ncbi:MAG TPA: glycoside hydrolase family 44 protein [Gemmataceae bacterium]|nr:glycoside hydrolase family 44 protein [Gemmataceae bacterium]